MSTYERIVGALFRHKENLKVYMVQDCAKNPNTGKVIVTYWRVEEKNKTYWRPYDEFFEKFEHVPL